jgi:hypothetical protein
MQIKGTESRFRGERGYEAMNFTGTASRFFFKHTANARHSCAYNRIIALSLFVLFAMIGQMSCVAQDTAKLIYLSEASSVGVNDMVKNLQKECPNTSFTTDKTKNDYILEARTSTSALQDGSSEPQYVTTNDLVLFDRDHLLLRASSSPNLGNAVKDLCHAIKNSVLIQVVDSQTMTESLDARGVSGGPGAAGLVGTIVNDTTGRRTHTDNSILYVVANGERAILDCYERSKGCTPIGDGKFYAEFDGESIWVDFRMPLIHRYVRNHYVVAGGW